MGLCAKSPLLGRVKNITKGNAMKTLKIICLILSISMLASFMIGCEDKVPSFVNTISSGEKVALCEDALSISADFKPMKAKDGLIPGANVQIKVSGYDALTYYEAAVTFTWEYEYLGDTPEYVTAQYSQTVQLDNMGFGEFKDKIDFTNYRSIKNIELTVTFEGDIVKK